MIITGKRTTVRRETKMDFSFRQPDGHSSAISWYPPIHATFLFCKWRHSHHTTQWHQQRRQNMETVGETRVRNMCQRSRSTEHIQLRWPACRYSSR